MNRRISIAFVLALALGLAVFGVASAHAKLVSSDPAAGANLTKAPAKITLVFSEEISEKEADSFFVVTNEKNAEVGRGKLDNTDIDHKTLSGALSGTLADGVYTVKWQALTPDDNGMSNGSFTFGVNKAPGAQPTAAAHEEAEPTAAAGSAAQPTAVAQASAPAALPRTGANDLPIGGALLLAGVLLAGGLALRRGKKAGR